MHGKERGNLQIKGEGQSWASLEAALEIVALGDVGISIEQKVAWKDPPHKQP